MTKTANVNSLSEGDKKKLKGVVQEISDSLTRIEAEKDFQKESLDTICDELNLEKKLVSRLAKTYHKATFTEEKETFETFEDFYTMILEK